MDAEIIEEDEEWIGVQITDNKQHEHKIAVEFDGKIRGHSQDGYPDDPAKRTDEGNEHVDQARRFARYYVSVERGYDTMPPLIDPNRLEAVRQVIEMLSTDECMTFFGDLYQQMASHHGDTQRVRSIPDTANPETVLYRKDVYLGVDPSEIGIPEQAESLASKYGFDLKELAIQEPVTSLTASERSRWKAFSDELGSLVDETDADISAGVHLGSASELYMAYGDSRGQEYVTDVDQPLNRDPDARFELPPIDPRSQEAFHEYLAFNIKCQIRDCFVRMGVEPPAPFRVLGYGRYEATERYNTVDFYPTYHDPENPVLLG